MPAYDPVETAVNIWMADDIAESESPEVRDYNRYVKRKWIFIGCCVIATFLAAGYALKVGAYDIGYWKTYEVVWNHIFGEVDPTNNDDYVIWELKMPRVITGILAGIGLAASGVVMQTILRNPLADPYTTGISSGASFGASLAIGLGISLAGAGYAVITNAFIFALVPMAVILIVSKMKGASPTTMIMAGIAIMYLFNAMTMIIKLWVDPDKLSSIYEWSVGTLEGNSWDDVTLMAIVVFVGYTIMQIMARKLNVLSTGDETARSMGIDADQIRLISLLVVSLVAAGVVCFTGLIGFVGLVCPHISRLVIGSDNRYLLPASAIFGAALLLFADGIGRWVISPGTIQVGVITAFIGAPLFLYLIIKQKSEVT